VNRYINADSSAREIKWDIESRRKDHPVREGANQDSGDETATYRANVHRRSPDRQGGMVAFWMTAFSLSFLLLECLEPLGRLNNRIRNGDCSFHMERVMGIEPTLAAWEAAVLPLNYTRGGR
jgi:hypothetical protein